MEDPLNNSGVSFLVAPHNLTFNEKAKKLVRDNNQKAIESMLKLVTKHEAKTQKRGGSLSKEDKDI